MLNDNLFGEITLDKECFIYDEIPEKEICKVKNHEILNHFKPEEIVDGRISNVEEVEPKPCQWGLITENLHIVLA